MPSKDDDLRMTDRLPHDLPQANTQPRISSRSSPSNAMAPSRAGTLAWQQRPNSRGSTSARSRPLSMVAADNIAGRSPHATPEPTAKDDAEMSKSQITQALGSKDPAWFKQTADRGTGSPAYRKEQEDTISDITSMSGSVRLPGLHRASTVESGREEIPMAESERFISPSAESSERHGSGWSHEYSSSASISSRSGIRSPLPISSAQIFEPPISESASSADNEQPGLSRTLAMSPSQGRISPEKMERPSSPTKGLGGFVQSAMLKRSDSVNKRWSAQAGPGLSRGNSTASNFSGRGGSGNTIAGLTGSMSPPKEGWASSGSREASPLSSSRPGSSYSNTTLTQGAQDNVRSETSESFRERFGSPSDDGFAKPAIPHHARSRSVVPTGQSDGDVAQPVTTPPTSPSKTMDPRRWSPSKASWLESAINKPDSPKPRAAPPQQPSWMVEINRAKQQRGSVDLGKGSVFKEVKPEALLRSPPLGGTLNPSSVVGRPNGFDSHTVKNSGPKDKHVTEQNVTLKDQSVQSDSLTPSPKPSKSIQSASTPPIQEPTVVAGDREPLKDVQTVPNSKSNQSQPAQTVKPSGTSSKPKPETPPKNDLRTVLKPRQVSGGERVKEEPEFKNVFGKLKRTQTQNYVASDELKNNILRGKAGLAVTGGPKKTERVDELKESILKKKEEMKAGGPSTMVRKTSGNSVTKPRDPPPPEAIMKKNALIRSESTLSNGSNSSIGSDRGSITPEAISKQKILREKPKAMPPEKLPLATKGARTKDSAGSGKLAERFNPALADLISRVPSPLAAASAPTKNGDPIPPNDSYTAKMDSSGNSNEGQLVHMTKGRARGPKRRLPTASTEPSKTILFEPPSISTPQTRPPNMKENSKPLSAWPPSVSMAHDRPLVGLMNNSDRSPHVPDKPYTPPKKPHIAEMAPKSPGSPKSPKSPRSPKFSQIPNVAESLSSQAQTPIVDTSTPTRQKPVMVAKDMEQDAAKRETSFDITPQSSPTQSGNVLQGRQRQVSQSMQRNQPQHSTVEDDGASVSVKNAAALWGQSTTSPSKDTRSKSPIKLPTRKDEERALEEAGLRGVPIEETEPIGLGLQPFINDSQTPKPFHRPLPSPPIQSPRSPPIPAKKPKYTANRVISNGTATVEANLISPRPQTSEASKLLSEFFEQPLTPNVKVDVNAHAILSSGSQESDKIKTLRKQIWEITRDGKRLPVPSHQEHILFEDSMYLCTHVFGAANGARVTETYLWAGDGVASSAVQNAQLFSRKVAKEQNGKLIILRQGKEIATFFQALGGIVITRRGSSSRADSSALYMLCGRRHVGQIAFDEVPMTPQSLCSGFPYIISAKFGKLYLWKGKGSSADELGCARLIGMDLGLTGEIEEVDEGHEPQSFFDAFPTGSAKSIPKSADHWRLKPSFENYRCRLFSIEHETRQKASSPFWGRRGSAPLEDRKPTAQIRDIVPFCQSDLEVGGIYVLDAFFEIYM